MPKANKKTDRLLENISVKYSNNEYIAEQAAPALNVKKTSDLYRIYERQFRLPETIRSDKGLAREHDFDVSTAAYSLQKHALKMYISQDEMENYDVGDLMVDATEELTDKILMRKERSLADLMTTTNFSLGVSLAAAFTSNTTTTNPIPIFDTGTSTIINNAGMRPTWAIIPRASMVAIKNHVSVIERVKYTSKDITKEIIAGLLDVPKILTPNAVEDTAAEGLTSTISSMFAGGFILLGHSPASAGLKKVSTFYQLKKARPMVKKWVDEERDDAQAVEVQQQYQIKVVASLTAYYINGAA